MAASTSRPRIALVWGDHPWHEPPKRVGKLLSIGALYRNLARALAEIADEVRPWSRDEPRPGAIDAHLDGVDIVFGDAYTHTFPFLERRIKTGAQWRAVLLAHGNMPKAGDPLFTLAPHLVRPGDAIVFSSSADQAIWRRLMERHQVVEAVVPLAVDTETFHPEPGPGDHDVRRRYGLPADVPLLLFVGRHNIQKNLHGLLDVLAEARRHITDVHLALVGEPDDIQLAEFQVANTGYVDYLQAHAAELGVDAAVHFCGPAFGDDLAGLYRTADVVVNLGFYHRENFGLSQAEAQACATPVVCSAWGGFRDVVQDGQTGVLVDAVMTRCGIRVNRADAADAVVRLLENGAQRDEMARAAANFASGLFSVARFSERLAAVIEHVRSAPRGTGPAFHSTPLARRYFEHASAHGWSDPDADGWEPPMYGGDDYEIYEELVGPYASAKASELDPAMVAAESIPVRASDWALDHPRRLLTDLDPVWPHRRFLDASAWRVVTRIDGAATVSDLARLAGARIDDVRHVVARLHREGFVLFRRRP